MLKDELREYPRLGELSYCYVCQASICSFIYMLGYCPTSYRLSGAVRNRTQECVYLALLKKWHMLRRALSIRSVPQPHWTNTESLWLWPPLIKQPCSFNGLIRTLNSVYISIKQEGIRVLSLACIFDPVSLWTDYLQVEQLNASKQPHNEQSVPYQFPTCLVVCAILESVFTWAHYGNQWRLREIVHGFTGASTWCCPCLSGWVGFEENHMWEEQNRHLTIYQTEATSEREKGW